MEVVLIVDDEQYIREELGTILQQDDRELLYASDGVEAVSILGNHHVDLILTDIRMPNMDGFELIKRVKELWSSIPIITITAYASTETAVQALRLGAYDYITKPFSIDEIKNIINHALQAQRLFNEVHYLRGQLTKRYSMDNLIGQCPAMQKIYDTVAQVASAPCNVLVTGESGTGKELVAQAIHHNSSRSSGRFVPINCGSIPEGLLESELFGHIKGAFTGAVEDKPGLVVMADGGTLFLDEIGDMPLNLQVKLLRLLQNRELQPVGSTKTRKVDIRIIAATNVDLSKRVSENTFRSDLFYRINVVEIHLPPLKDRGSDISLLINSFLKHYSKVLSKNVDRLSPKVESAFNRYSWPGNVRELENAIERAVTLSASNTIEISDIPSKIANYVSEEQGRVLSLNDMVSKFENQCIEDSLEANNYDLNAASKDLDVSLATLYRKLKKLRSSSRSRIVSYSDKKTYAENTSKELF